MTLNELIQTLQSWQLNPSVLAKPPEKQFLESDFGVLGVSGTDITVDINNDGTLSDAQQGAPE